jgi:hypothetical protein
MVWDVFCFLHPDARAAAVRKIGHSPERGHRPPPVFYAANKRATKVPIAGAATMLKNGVCSLHRTTIG